MAKPLLILMRMDNSNHPHMDKLLFMVLMVDDHISISIPELNDEDYFPPVMELEDDEYEEGPVDDNPTKYLSDDEYMPDTEDVIPSQDKNRLGGKILAVWERYNPLLYHDYSRAGYILSGDTNTYAHVNVGVMYIYVNYRVIVLQFTMIKRN